MHSLEQYHNYKPGLTKLQVMQKYSLDKVIKLGSNENPYSPNTKMLHAMQEALVSINRYPEDGANNLVETLAIKHGVQTDQIILGNGSSELLDLIVHATINPGDQVIISDYAFSLYTVLCRMAKAEILSIPETNYHVDLQAMSENINKNTKLITKLIFITNPGNPTGTYIAYKEIESFIASVPSNVVVVIDEAYFEYVHVTEYSSALSLLNRFDNVVITRTFSKAYGLAGLRIGYALANKNIINRLKAFRKPFSVNSMAIAAASVAINDQSSLCWTVFSNHIELKKIEATLKQLGLNYIPSVTNFISVELGAKVDEIFQALLKRGVITRTLKEYNMNNYLRFSIGSSEENEIAFEELRVCLQKIGVH